MIVFVYYIKLLVSITKITLIIFKIKCATILLYDSISTWTVLKFHTILKHTNHRILTAQFSVRGLLLTGTPFTSHIWSLIHSNNFLVSKTVYCARAFLKTGAGAACAFSLGWGFEALLVAIWKKTSYHDVKFNQNKKLYTN